MMLLRFRHCMTLADLTSPPLFFRDKKEATAYTLSDIVKIKRDVVCKSSSIVLGTINVNSSYINIFYNGIYFSKTWPKLICFYMEQFCLLPFNIIYTSISFSLLFLPSITIHSIDSLALVRVPAGHSY